MGGSRHFMPQIEPVGTFPSDTSPYGVHDLAGGGCANGWPTCTAKRRGPLLSAEPEPGAGAERGASPMRMVRSGNWHATQVYCRAASRTPFPSLVRGTGLGFRLAHSLRRR